MLRTFSLRRFLAFSRDRAYTATAGASTWRSLAAEKTRGSGCRRWLALLQVIPFALPVMLIALPVAGADDWTEFRGPTGQGHAIVKGLPVQWSDTENVKWKQDLPGLGWSSPVVSDGKVFLTTAVAKGDNGDAGQSLRVMCLSAVDGTKMWDEEVFAAGADAPKIHGKNSHASPTAIISGDLVFVHFGHQGTACLSRDGKIRWRSQELSYSPVHGNGGTPVLYKGSLFFSADGGDNPFVASLAGATGAVRWKTTRACDAVKKFAFSTPLMIEVNGKPQLISPGSHSVGAFDPESGREIWRVNYVGYSVIPRPVVGHGMVYVSTSYDSPEVLAIRTDGTGDVTETHVAWRLKKGAPHTPSMLLQGDELYMVSDNGIASCVDAKTGEVHWQERLGGNFSASPLLAEDRIYFQNETGVGTVVRASKKFEKLATNDLKDRTLASYGVVDQSLLIRTASHLYRIQDR
ncbi:MAG: hypothetical protein RIS70_4369 [Planctomycetota bacterium]|jgi:outer membrane protein assembly factor BamB